MDNNSLLAFVTVAKTQSFSQAAKQLFLTQSAISKRIAMLEEQLNTPLFDRIGRRISLTPAGSALLPKAQHILRELDDAQRLINNLSGQVQGSLSLAASHHISLHRLPKTLQAFNQRYPQVKLNVHFDESEKAYTAILQADLEIAIITLSDNPDSSINSIPIWHDPLYYVCAKNHPLAQKHKVNLKDLTAHLAILPDKNTFTRKRVEQLFNRHQLRLNAGMETNYLNTIRMMVSIGLGWSLLPASLMGSDLVSLPVEAEPVHRTLGVIHRHDRTLSNAAHKFIELLLTNKSL